MKKIANLIFKQFSTCFAIFINFLLLFCFFILNISFSDNDNSFKIVFITAGIKEEYIIETI